MLVDTHAHIQLPVYDGDRDEIIERARRHGVRRLVAIGIDLPTSRAAVALAAAWPGYVYAAVGVHPHHAETLDAATLVELRNLLGRPGVVAVGETGLDFHRHLCPRELQEAAFAVQRQLAAEAGLPLVVHCREAHEAVLAALKDCRPEVPVVMHCYTTHPAYLASFIDLGCHLGMGGPVTFPKAAEAHTIAREVPLERLLLETDCPYLAPQPYRGRTGEPWHVTLVAEGVARVRGLAVEQVIAATGANAARVFGWDES